MNTTFKTVKALLLLFILVLFFSGLSVLPVDKELSFLLRFLEPNRIASTWIESVLASYRHVERSYPHLLYGYDWLAFAHFVLAILFIGPYRNPVKNIWVIEFGIIASVFIIPFALVAGYFRDIPFWWRLIDASFGVGGFWLLYYCRKKIRALSKKYKHANC